MYIYIVLQMVISDPHQQSTQISQKQDGHKKHVIMKIICPPGYHHSGFVTTHAPGHMMYVYTLLVPMIQRLLNKLSKEHI